MPIQANATQQPAPSSQRGFTAHLDEWVTPAIADDGVLRAGKVLDWMDTVGSLAAARHCRMPVVTVSVDGVTMRDLIKVGERVTMTAALAHTSERSLGVCVSMTHGALDAEAPRPALDAYMSFVAVDAKGTPVRVPQFVPETPAEVARFREGNLRREFRAKLASGAKAIPVPAAGEPADRETTLYIREFLKSFPRSVRFPWDRAQGRAHQGRAGSYVHTMELVRSATLNFHGTLHGGVVMNWLETNAALSARAYLRGKPTRMIALHGLTFIRPVPPNRLVHIQSVVVHSTPRSLTVLANVQAEDPILGVNEETLRGFLTYAPLDPAASVPQLTCATDEERAVFDEVERRLALQQSIEPDGA
jgi:acyl-CoA hydrolase